MRLESILIKSNIKDYTVNFVNDNEFISGLSNMTNSLFIVDSNVWKYHRDTTLESLNRDNIIILPINEDKKNLDTVQELYEKIMQYFPKRNLNLISIGGGIVQDITGFVASSLYRGINWIFIPTTLLAQVDSCIGAKTSLNFKKYKNLIGTFYPPTKIYLYPEFLKTLTKADYYSGVGEMAKLHLMGGEADTTIFINSLAKIDEIDNAALLERTQKCLNIKKSYIENDEFDTGRRNMLNYGHCFGHAIESSTNFAISHGQAVVLGMIIANLTARERNLLSSENEKYIREKILYPVFKTNMDNININIEETIAAMSHDKKNLGNGLALVMISDNYEMIKITDMSKEEAIKSLKMLEEVFVCLTK